MLKEIDYVLLSNEVSDYMKYWLIQNIKDAISNVTEDMKNKTLDKYCVARLLNGSVCIHGSSRLN